MRHRRRSRRFDRTASHLKAMMKNMTTSLFEHERIVTTPEKAKECRRIAERLITIAKKGGLTNYRRAMSMLASEDVAHKLFHEIAPRYANRAGGYTRILHLADVRLGDAARQCIFELVEEESSKKRKPVKRASRAKKPEGAAAEGGSAD
jgi:large subunit ribosomal protein L17